MTTATTTSCNRPRCYGVRAVWKLVVRFGFLVLVTVSTYIIHAPPRAPPFDKIDLQARDTYNTKEKHIITRIIILTAIEYGVGQPSRTQRANATIIILAEASIYSLRRAEPTQRTKRKWVYSTDETFTTVLLISSADTYRRLPTDWRGSVVRRRQLLILTAATLRSRVERMQCGWRNSLLDGLD